MYQNQWFLSLFPSKRQFMLALLFEIPSGGLIKAVFRESVGRTTAVWKRRQTVHSGVAGWVYYGIRVKKTKRKGLFTCSKVHETASPQDSKVFYKSVGLCNIPRVGGEAFIFLWNSASFSFKIPTLTNDSLCIWNNRSFKCPKAPWSVFQLCPSAVNYKITATQTSDSWRGQI